MNVARQALLYDGLTSVAQRVYEATPIKEYWSANQVLQELHRQGRSMTLNEVTGCLNSLKNRKLVRETKAGFCRTHVIEKDAAPVAPLKVVQPAVAPTSVALEVPAKVEPPAPTPPIDRLAAISARLAGVMTTIGGIVADIEAAALDIESQLTEGDEEVQKLRQLKSLIASIK
jgi:hypothetical protein